MTITRCSTSCRRIVGCAAIALAMITTTTIDASAAGGVAPQQATLVQREQAQSRFLRGKEKFAKKDYEGALAEFNASLDIVSSPNTRLYVGRSLRELNRTLAAYVELGRTEIEAKELARDDPRYEKAAQSAHDERSKLEPKLAFINVAIAHAEPNTTLKVAGDEIRRGGWSEPLPVMPGDAELVVESPGRAPVKRSVQIVAGEKKTVEIDAAEGAPTGAVAETPKPADKSSSSSSGTMRNMAYVTGGAAIVGLGMFAYFGLKANGTHSDLEKACNNQTCPPGHEAQISEGRTQQTAANIGLAVFVVGAAATATLWVLSMPKSNSSSTSSAQARARIDVGPTFIGLRGAF